MFHSCSKGGGIVIVVLNVSVDTCRFFGYIGQPNLVMQQFSVLRSEQKAVCQAGFVQDLLEFVALACIVGTGLARLRTNCRTADDQLQIGY